MSRLLLLVLIPLAACAGVPEHDRSAAAPPGCRTTEQPATAEVRWLAAEPHLPELDAWCAAVGPALVRSVDLPATVQLDSLLVVTWNVHVGGGDLDGFIRLLRAGRITGGAPVEHFALLLQETFRGGVVVPDAAGGAEWAPGIENHPPRGERASIGEVARRHGLSVVYVPSMRNGGARVVAEREDRGNAILATLPLAEPVALELPVARQRRVAVAAVARGRTGSGAEWELQLASVHLENRGRDDIVGVRGRARQAEWLVQALPPAHNAVLGADLNTWVRSENEAAKSAVLPHYPQTERELPPGPTHEAFIIFRPRLDYLFARVPGGEMTNYRRVRELFGSDHYPLYAWIHLADHDVRGLSGPQ